MPKKAAGLTAAKVQAAYQRGDLLERRRKLMDTWAAFCSRPAATGDVVELHATRATAL